MSGWEGRRDPPYLLVGHKETIRVQVTALWVWLPAS